MLGAGCLGRRRVLITVHDIPACFMNGLDNFAIPYPCLTYSTEREGFACTLNTLKLEGIKATKFIFLRKHLHNMYMAILIFVHVLVNVKS